MEVGRTEVGIDEFEKLLGEIPNATSGSTNSDEAAPKRVPLSYTLSPLTEKMKSGGTFDVGKTRIPAEEANLPDDQSLTSAFAEMRINSNGFGLKETASDINSPYMVIPPFQSSTNYLPCSFDEFDATKVVRQESSNFMPCGFNLPVAGLDFPLVETQATYPYVHSQQLSQTPIGWRNIEHEQYYRMHHQYLYLQHVRNQQRLELLPQHHPTVQLNGNSLVPTKLMNRSSLRQQQQQQQPCFEIPNRVERPNTEACWTNYALPRGMNPSNPSLAYGEYNNSTTMHFMSKVGKQSYPEKILTRSQGLNTVKAVKFGGNESLPHANQNGKVLPNGHFRLSLSTPRPEYFHVDGLSSWPLSPETTTDLKPDNFRIQAQKYNSVNDVSGKIYLMAKDQHGCRFLQRKISEGSSEDIEKIFVEIIDHIVELMMDPFGNYLVQKLVEVCDENQKTQILYAITRESGDLIRISCDMHGTRAVQKVIEMLKSPEQFSLVVSSLKPGIVALIKNMNGNHVAQRCLLYLLPEYSKFLFEAAINHCVDLATDRHGCCVLQKCLSHSEGELRRHLVCEVTSKALILSQDPFGNYVVQYVFELCLPWATTCILDQLDGRFVELSMQKYSSNVVEKCLIYASEERRGRIIREMISNTHLDQVMQDPYGNYVVQAALHQSKGALHAALVDAIRPHVPVLRTSPYGKKVLSSNNLKK